MLWYPPRYQLKVAPILPGEEPLQTLSDSEMGAYQKHRVGKAAIPGIDQFIQHLPSSDHAHMTTALPDSGASLHA
jgi:hypothetical protein